MLKFEIVGENQRSGTGAGQKVSEFVVVSVEDDWQVGRDVAHQRARNTLNVALEWAQKEGDDEEDAEALARIAALENENEKLQTRLRLCVEDLTECNMATIPALRAENDRLHKQSRLSDGDIPEDPLDAFDKLKARHEALRERYDRVAADNTRITLEKNEIRKDNDRLRKQFAQSEENEAELVREVKALREEVKRLQGFDLDEMKRLQAEVKYLELRKKELEFEVDDLREYGRTREKEAERREKTITELRAENADQKADAHATAGVMLNQKETIVGLERDLLRVESQVERFKEDREEWMRKIDKLKGDAQQEKERHEHQRKLWGQRRSPKELLEQNHALRVDLEIAQRNYELQLRATDEWQKRFAALGELQKTVCSEEIDTPEKTWASSFRAAVMRERNAYRDQVTDLKEALRRCDDQISLLEHQVKFYSGPGDSHPMVHALKEERDLAHRTNEEARKQIGWLERRLNEAKQQLDKERSTASRPVEGLQELRLLAESNHRKYREQLKRADAAEATLKEISERENGDEGEPTLRELTKALMVDARCLLQHLPVIRPAIPLMVEAIDELRETMKEVEVALGWTPKED